MKMLSPLKICTFTIIIFALSTHTYAEYYLVYSAQPCCVVAKKHYAVKKHIVKKNHVVVKRSPHTPLAHYKKSHRPKVAVYSISYPSPCCACHEVWIQGRWDCYGGCAPPPAKRISERMAGDTYGYSYATTEITYNPDLTTGDDDTWVDPNMNIDG